MSYLMNWLISNLAHLGIRQQLKKVGLNLDEGHPKKLYYPCNMS